MNHTQTHNWGLRAGIAIAVIVFLQLFFVGVSSLVAAEVQTPVSEPTSTTISDQVLEPESSSSTPELPTTELVAPDEQPIMEQPLVEEPPVDQQSVLTEPDPTSSPPVNEQTVDEQPLQEVVTPESIPAPEISTDKPDYFPWESVTVFGKFFESFKNIVVTIAGGVGETYREFVHQVQTNAEGAFTVVQQLDNVFRPDYTATVTDENGEVLAQVAFTDAQPATDINQCQNGGVGAPLQPCSESAPFPAASGYGYEGNAAANSSNSHWTEGDFVPLRIVATDFAAGAGYIDFSIDVTKGGKHAYDYIGSFDATETTGATAGSHFNNNNPVTDIIAGASPASPDSIGTIPAATLSPFPVACGSNTFTGTQTPGQIKSWGTSGTLTVSYVTQNVGSSDCTTRVRVAWSNTKAGFGGKIVIAYGAHIAKQTDWGVGNSAISISGSPYHTSLVERNTGGDTKGIGNQDAKLSASAVVLPNTITIRKVMVGGTATFTFTGTPNGTINTNNGTLTASPGSGAGSVTESALAGWSLTSLTCSAPTGGATVTPNLGTRTVSYTMPAAGGGGVDCTFTNTLQQAQLTLVKTVTNDNGGQATPAQWTLAASGPTPISGVTGNVAVTNAAVNAGTYTLSESGGPNGYTATTYSCVKNGGQAVVSNSIVLAAGDNATCTINNNDDPAHLIVIKHVINDNGGTATAADFTMQINSVTAAGGNSFAGVESPGVDKTLTSVGTYSVTESGPAGYTASLSADCSGSIALGQTKTCTITNNDQQAYIIVDKTVVNDNGGTAAANDFLLKVDGASVVDEVAYPVNPGAHTASETNLAGYTAGAWGGDCNSNAQVTVALGETKTCTITNNDIQPQLTLIKTVINDNGGTKQVADFPLFVDSTSVTSGEATGFNAGIYAASETADPGYSASTWSGDCSPDGSVTLAIGDNKTCEITNNDIAPTLKLVKTVINDNGGSAVTTDFQGKINGNNVPWNVAQTMTAGNHTASEINLPNYSALAWGGDCNADGTITLALAQTAICTITNDDDAPKLTLNKVVINDNGGTAAESYWTLTAAGLTPLSGPGAAGAADVVSDSTFSAGTYTLSESSGPAGYSASAWSCSNQDNDGQIVINLGDDITCTITNDDQPAHLTLIKTVTNDNGGLAQPTAWSLTASGPTGISGATGGQAVTNAPVSAGNYTLGEQGGPDGYTAGTYSCIKNGGQEVVGNSISLALGDEATCTINNDDDAPSLTLVKVVINEYGGTATAADFTLTASGPTGFSGLGPSVVNGASFDAGVYDLSESGPAGYDASAWVCSGTGTQSDADTITLGLGQSATCTITNTDQAPHLIVIKHVINDNGGTLAADDFTMNVTATDPLDASFAGQEAPGTNITLDAGSYSVDESVVSGYAKSLSADCSGTIALGETKTCTITNDDIAPTLTVNKIVVPAQDSGLFNLQIDGNTAGTGSNVGNGGTTGAVAVSSGAHTVSEVAGTSTNLSDYTAVITGDCAADGSITLDLAENGVCTITNTKKGRVIVDKITNPVGDAQSFAFTTTGTGYSGFNLTDAAEPNNQQVLPGVYSVAETAVSGWTQTSATCSDGSPVTAIDVAPGETVTCTFTNTKQGKITITKDAQPNDCQNFSFAMTGQTAFSLDDDTDVADCNDSNLAASQTFNSLAPGGFVVTESLPNSFWKLKTVNCGNNNNVASSFQTSATGVTIDLLAGGDVTCTFVNEKPSPTRTLGFWQTHTAYTTTKFNALMANFFVGSNVTVAPGTHKGKLTSSAQVFGGFYASIPKTTTGAKRTDVDKARIQLLQQLLAAKLNCGTFGCTQPVKDMIASADAAYAGNNVATINSYISQLDAYNNSGDTIQIGNAGKATPKDSQSQASLSFWDLP